MTSGWFKFPKQKPAPSRVTRRSCVNVGDRMNVSTLTWCTDSEMAKLVSDMCQGLSRYQDDRIPHSSREKIVEGARNARKARADKGAVLKLPPKADKPGRGYGRLPSRKVATAQGWVYGDMIHSDHWRLPQRYEGISGDHAMLRTCEGQGSKALPVKTVPADARVVRQEGAS